MIYNLPKPYLSYSQYTIWKSSKDSYRKRYYLKEAPFTSPETLFGNKIGDMVENEEHMDDDVVSQIINYPCKEYKVETEHEGLQLLGYIDQFDDKELRIMEMKTGHKNKQGKSPWDRMKVRKHKQLVFYSMLVKLKHGTVHEEVILQWLETEFAQDSREFDGHTLTTKSRNLKLTGNIETFKRTIKDWEIDNMLEDVLLVAAEITEDYELWKTKK